MKAHIAQRAGDARNADRAYLTDAAAIVLDGATAFAPVDVDPATYVAVLGEAIADQLDDDPAAALPSVVAAGITRTAMRLDLTPDQSPSSTVAILRARQDAADLYVLGDSPIHYGTTAHAAQLADDRLAHVAAGERRRYRDRLRAGHGYDQHHRAALAQLQHTQRATRNTPTGYWIAETDPDAAHHARILTVPADAITWAVLATDGAADLINHTGRSWPAIAHAGPAELAALLDQLHEWETTTDPNGRALPRAKRHDDKTVVAIASLW